MKKIWETLSQHRVLVLTATFFAGILLLFLFLRRPKPTPTPLPPPSWDNLTPGVSTKGQVIDELGQPVSESNGISSFKSSSLTRHHEASFSEDKVTILKEVVTIKDQKKVNDITSEYGEPELVLYGPDTVNGFDLFAFPSKGVAYLGNQRTSELKEVWYFVPTDRQKFISTLASGYSLTRSPIF